MEIKINIDLKKLLVIKVIFLFCLISCNQSTENSLNFSFERIEQKIDEYLFIEEVDVINMEEIIPFSWEDLYIFKPYTSINEINDELGFNWDGAEKTFVNQDDNYNLLVFVKDKTIIHYIKWPRNKGDFSKINQIKYFNESAKFIAKKEKIGSQDWIYLYPEKGNE